MSGFSRMSWDILIEDQIHLIENVRVLLWAELLIIFKSETGLSRIPWFPSFSIEGIGNQYID